MKTIIASQKLVNGADGSEVLESLDRHWAGFWWRMGWMLIPAPSSVPAEVLMEQSSPSALLLTGGNDLALMSDDPLSHERDVGERDLLRIARDKHLPVIGICRGMQFLVAEAGGSLVRVHEHVGQGHPIVAAENLPASFRRRDLNRESVKSFHNFGVSELPAGMHALARSPDGFVEACLDLENRRLGIMWHPERQSPADPKDLSLLQRFLDIPL